MDSWILELEVNGLLEIGAIGLAEGQSPVRAGRCTKCNLWEQVAVKIFSSINSVRSHQTALRHRPQEESWCEFLCRGRGSCWQGWERLGNICLPDGHAADSCKIGHCNFTNQFVKYFHLGQSQSQSRVKWHALSHSPHQAHREEAGRAFVTPQYLFSDGVLCYSTAFDKFPRKMFTSLMWDGCIYSSVCK